MKGYAKKSVGEADKLCERFDAYCKKVIYHAVHNRVYQEMRYYGIYWSKSVPIDEEVCEEDRYQVINFAEQPKR